MVLMKQDTVSFKHSQHVINFMECWMNLHLYNRKLKTVNRKLKKRCPK